MQVASIKTHKITTSDRDILKIIDQYVINLQEKSVVVVTSKIVSITEGRVVEILKQVQNDNEQKDKLIEQESQYFLPRNENPYNVSLTITNNTLVASAGIDESNGNGYYVLWPKDPQISANKIREHLAKKFNLKKIGVIITDSKTTPMRWGVTAIAIAYSGFNPLKDYIGKPDIFGKTMEYTKMNIADNLACAAAVVIGEGAEQTPMAVISDLQNVEFIDRNPSKEELKAFQISKEEDIYSPFLNSVQWKKGLAKPDLAPREQKGKAGL